MVLALYLFLSHFAADFVFQSDELVKWKQKDFNGVMYHGIVHFLIQALLLIPFLAHTGVWIFIGIIAAMHIAIDQWKINIQRISDKYMRPFILDQLLHFTVISAVIYSMPLYAPQSLGPLSVVYENPIVPAIAIGLIFVTKTLPIMRMQMKLDRNAKR